MASDPEARVGREVLIDLGLAAAEVTGAYANFVLTTVDDHVVRMSVMTEPSGMTTERVTPPARPANTAE